jgi:GAF domain-containing protein
MGLTVTSQQIRRREPTNTEGLDITREVLALAEIGRIVSESNRLEDMYAQISACLRELVPVDRVVVLVVEPSTEELQREYIGGMDAVAPLDSPEERITPGILDKVRATGRAEKFDDLSALVDLDTDLKRLVELGFISAIYAPLMVQGEFIGILGVNARSPAAYTDADLDLLVRIARQIAGTVANAKLQQQTDRDGKEYELLYQLGRSVTSHLGIDEICLALASSVAPLIPYDRLAISTVDPVTDMAVTVFVKGIQVANYELDKPFSAAHFTELWTPESRTALVDSDYDRFDDDPAFESMGLRSALGVPLFWDDMCIGVLSFRSFKESAYGPRHIDLANRISDQIAGTFANAEMYGQVKRSGSDQELLARIGRAVNSSTDIDEVIVVFTDLVRQLIPADRDRKSVV